MTNPLQLQFTFKLIDHSFRKTILQEIINLKFVYDWESYHLNHHNKIIILFNNDAGQILNSEIKKIQAEGNVNNIFIHTIYYY